jgi:hypothetical protein
LVGGSQHFKGMYFLHLQGFKVHFFMVLEALKIKETYCFSMSGATYPVMQVPILD